MNLTEIECNSPVASRSFASAVAERMLPSPDFHFTHVTPIVDKQSLRHRQVRTDKFWQAIPAYADIDELTFLDHNWQARNTVTRIEKLLGALSGLASPKFLADAIEGLRLSPMSMRVRPTSSL